MEVIRVNNIRKSYGKYAVLKGISLHVRKGRIVGLLGPNGSGKSTLLKIISGLVIPDAGDVEINKLSLRTDINRIMQSVGVLIEEPGIYEYMNAMGNMNVSSMLHGKNDKQKSRKLLNMFELDPDSKVKAAKYSTGMKQRLGICMAMVHDPEILILDEPTNGLDADGIVLLRNTLKRFKEDGNTVVIATHLLSEAKELCDDIVLINNGVVLEEFSYRNDEGSEMEIYSIKLTGLDQRLFEENLAQISTYRYWLNSERLEVIIAESELGKLVLKLNERGMELDFSQFSKMSLEDFYLRKVSGVL